MKKIILSLVLFCFAYLILNAQSPTFQWAKNMGGEFGPALGRCVALDNSNNVYTIGEFEGKVDFDPGAGTFYLTSAGSDDIFISKLNASGNFVWAKQLGGAGSGQGKSIAVDGSGNVYATGYFSGTADFDPGAGTFNLTVTGSHDVFICKLDAAGNFVWAKQLGGASGDNGNAIAIDGAGNVYSTGNFGGTADFDPGAGTFNLISAGSNDVFISKLDASGNFVWAKKLGGISSEYGYSIKADGSGNVYSTGNFLGTADFDPGAGTFNLTSSGSFDIFISKLNASGDFVWAKQLGGVSGDNGNSVAIDGAGNVYSTGNFGGTADFDPGAGTFNLTATGADIYVTKLDPSGNLLWAKQLGGALSDYGYSIAVDGSGNVYSSGYFYGTADFDPGAGTFNVISSGSYDIFISKLDGSGNFVWAKKSGGTSNDYGSSIALDGSGNVYTTGYFYRTADFDPGAAIFNLIIKGNDAGQFISKLNSSGSFLWAKSAGSSSATFGISIATDLSGNVLTTGRFDGTVDFDPGAGTFNLTSANSEDIFVSKSDASGNFVWAKQLGGTSTDRVNSIAADGSGNVYTIGEFYATIDLDPGGGTFNLTSAGFGDIFISKLDASGNFVWAKRIGGSGGDDGYSITIDAQGNIYATGCFGGTVDFDPGAGAFNLTTAGSIDIFISKLDAAGTFVWAKQLGGTSGDLGNSIAVDGAGYIYTTGYFDGTADFDPGASNFMLTSAGNQEIFISKLDASGNFIWAKQLGGISRDIANSIAVDGSGNVYTTGYFDGTGDFDPGAGIFSFTAGGTDIFISKLDASGNFVWAKQLGSIAADEGSAVTIDGSGYVYVTGSFNLIIDFDPGAGTYNLSAAGFYDIFISKFDASGNFIWANQLGGTSNDGGNSIAIDGAANVYTTGFFVDVADFNPGAGTFNLTTAGNSNALVHKMSQCTQPSALITPSGPTTFCSGGSVALNVPAGANKTYQWKKGANLISGATLSSYTATTGGNYRVIVTNTVTGCSKTTGSTTTVTVNALPAATITPQGPTTFCAGGSVVLSANTGAGLTYKWKKGSNYISGATLLNYTATTGGNYRVQVTNSNGCSKTSALVAVSVPCKEGESVNGGEGENMFDFTVYPNPNSGEFTIKFSTKPSFSIQIELTDEIGKAVKKFETNDETVVIKESNLAKGIYCLTARNNNDAVIKKINIVK